MVLEQGLGAVGGDQAEVAPDRRGGARIQDGVQVQGSQLHEKVMCHLVNISLEVLNELIDILHEVVLGNVKQEIHALDEKTALAFSFEV